MKLVLTLFIFLAFATGQAQSFGKGKFNIKSSFALPTGPGSKTGKGRGSNNRAPLPGAQGDHSVSDANGSTTYKTNPQNPTGFDEIKRVDIKGKEHHNVPPPHTKERLKSKKVRPATPDEIPKVDLSKN